MTSIVRSPSLAVALVFLITLADGATWAQSELRPGPSRVEPLSSIQPEVPLDANDDDYCPSGCGDAETDKIIEIAAAYTTHSNTQRAVDYLERCLHICRQPALICSLARIYFNWQGTEVKDISALLRMSQTCLTASNNRIDVRETAMMQQIQKAAAVEFNKRTKATHHRYRTIGKSLMGSGTVILGAGLASVIALSATPPDVTYTSVGTNCTSSSGISGDPCALDRRLPIGVVLGGVGAAVLAAGLVVYLKYPAKRLR